MIMLGLMWRSRHEAELRHREHAHASAMERMMADSQRQIDGLMVALRAETRVASRQINRVKELELAIGHLNEMLEEAHARVSGDERFRLLSDLKHVRNLMDQIVDRF